MSKFIISVDFDVESDEGQDETVSKLESFLSEKIEEFNHLTEENGEGFTIFDLDVVQVTEDEDFNNDDDEDDDD